MCMCTYVCMCVCINALYISFLDIYLYFIIKYLCYIFSFRYSCKLRRFPEVLCPLPSTDVESKAHIIFAV